jgi:hypothetical protein
VWFQNKRQAEKKAGSSVSASSSSSSSGQSGLRSVSKASENTTLRNTTRSRRQNDNFQINRDSLVTVTLDYGNDFSYKANPQKMVTRNWKVDSSEGQTQISKASGAVDDATISPPELGSALLTSSPALSDDSVDVHSPNAIGNAVNLSEGNGKGARMLEWACEHQRKRRKGNRGEVISSPAENEDSDADLHQALSISPEVATELSACLSGDIILGVVLLLRMQSSKREL